MYGFGLLHLENATSYRIDLANRIDWLMDCQASVAILGGD